MTNNICSFETCERPTKAKGLCNGHYLQLRRGAELSALREPGKKPCIFPGCDRLMHSRGLCPAHHQQRLRGVALTPIQTHAPCGHDGCEALVTSATYCKTHADRFKRKGSTDLDPSPTFRERFNAKVQKTETCWLWVGAKNHLGYGQIWDASEGRVVMAHRASVLLDGRTIPNGYDVDHLCRVPSCVRPDHLEPVTHAENMARAPHSAPDFQRNKTHCSKGHPFDDENTLHVVRKSGTRRVCLTCKRALANVGRRSRVKPVASAISS